MGQLHGLARGVTKLHGSLSPVGSGGPDCVLISDATVPSSEQCYWALSSKISYKRGKVGQGGVMYIECFCKYSGSN